MLLTMKNLPRLRQPHFWQILKWQADDAGAVNPIKSINDPLKNQRSHVGSRRTKFSFHLNPHLKDFIHAPLPQVGRIKRIDELRRPIRRHDQDHIGIQAPAEVIQEPIP